MKKLIPVLCLLLACFGAIAQTISGTPQMCTGGTRTLYGTPSGSAWTSSNPSVATVSAAGIVTGVAAGTAVISYGTVPGYATVIATVSATGAPISGTLAACIGGTTTLYCSAGGGVWSSSAPAVASINTTGVVAGLTSGFTTISYAYAGGCVSTSVLASTICCSGMPTAGATLSNVDSGCSVTTVVLTDTGASALTTYQWQQSLDSASWSDILPGISNPYSFTGLYATMFYRCKVTCVASGMTSYTAGKKIRSYVCCGGSTFTAGTVSASTTSCSACSLTLTSAGASGGSGISYQWQSASYAAGPFTNMPGATSTTYTFSPCGAYYYRLMASCTYGGSAFSLPVFVGYQYHIDSDSSGVPNAACNTNFGAAVNGYSPLLYLQTFYGDGTSDSVAATSLGCGSSFSNSHNYIYSGLFSVKRLLKYDGVPQDSTSYVKLQTCHTLPIKLYFDENGNCVKDSAEHWNMAPVSIRVDSNGVPVDTISVTSGVYYGAHGNPGDVYSFQLMPGSVAADCPLGGIIYDTIQSGAFVYPQKKFAVSFTSSAVLCDFTICNVVHGTGRHRQRGAIYVRNNYGTPDSSDLTLSFSPRYSDPPLGTSSPYSFSGNTLTWHLSPMSFSSETRVINYEVWAPMWGMLTPGDTVKQQVQITSASAVDVNSSNNGIIRTDTVKASWDPNFVAVTPSGCFDADGQQFQYTVHFENTGNDTAHSIYVLDTLSDFLDPRSIEVVMASHAMDIGVYQNAGFNVVKFDFPYINLLDTSHHGLCDGMVIYNIKARPGVAAGSVVKARAGIYFDINEVVMTNETGNTRGCSNLSAMAVSEQAVSVYPNPATKELMVNIGNARYRTLTITNVLGQEMLVKDMAAGVATVDVHTLPSGLYHVVLNGADGRQVLKFAKQ